MDPVSGSYLGSLVRAVSADAVTIEESMVAIPTLRFGISKVTARSIATRIHDAMSNIKEKSLFASLQSFRVPDLDTRMKAVRGSHLQPLKVNEIEALFSWDGDCRKNKVNDNEKQAHSTKYILGGIIIGGFSGASLSVAGVTALVPAVGFCPSGVLAGSVAAGIHSMIGNVTAGSLFASLQSAGVLGLATGTKVAVGAVGAISGGVAGAVAIPVIIRFCIIAYKSESASSAAASISTEIAELAVNTKTVLETAGATALDTSRTVIDSPIVASTVGGITILAKGTKETLEKAGGVALHSAKVVTSSTTGLVASGVNTLASGTMRVFKLLKR